MTRQKHFFLIRGLIREAQHWGVLPELIREAFPDSQITALDIPGAGIYYRESSPVSIHKMVQKMRESLGESFQPNGNKDCYLVAISLGGMIAAEWMRTFPQDFKKAILINTSYGGISPLFKRLMPSALKYLLKVPLLKGSQKEAHILRLVSNHAAVFDSTLKLWSDIQEQHPVSLSNTLRQMGAGALFKVKHFVPSIPILILASTQDRMVSVECSRAIAQKWSAPIEEHPSAGHDLSADDPKFIVERMKLFFT